MKDAPVLWNKGQQVPGSSVRDPLKHSLKDAIVSCLQQKRLFEQISNDDAEVSLNENSLKARFPPLPILLSFISLLFLENQ